MSAMDCHLHGGVSAADYKQFLGVELSNLAGPPSSVVWTPERMLLLAVIQATIHDIQHGDEDEREKAREWVAGDYGGFTFQTVLREVAPSADLDAAREALLRMPGSPERSIRRRREYVFHAAKRAA